MRITLYDVEKLLCARYDMTNIISQINNDMDLPITSLIVDAMKGAGGTWNQRQKDVRARDRVSQQSAAGVDFMGRSSWSLGRKITINIKITSRAQKYWRRFACLKDWTGNRDYRREHVFSFIEPHVEPVCVLFPHCRESPNRMQDANWTCGCWSRSPVRLFARGFRSRVPITIGPAAKHTDATANVGQIMSRNYRAASYYRRCYRRTATTICNSPFIPNRNLGGVCSNNPGVTSAPQVSQNPRMWHRSHVRAMWNTHRS